MFAVVVATVLLPLSPLAPLMDFEPLPATFLAVVGIIVLLYVLTAEIAKRFFYGVAGYNQSSRETPRAVANGS